MSSAIDLLAVAGGTPSGVTIAEAAVALFGGDSHAERSAARLCLHRLVEKGQLRKVRGHPQSYGSVPDRFVAVTARP
jgi:fructose-1,6-bisphosphatase/sedoheptulose 1,7-bisphosphatase-like protein